LGYAGNEWSVVWTVAAPAVTVALLLTRAWGMTTETRQSDEDDEIRPVPLCFDARAVMFEILHCYLSPR
jgi:hypothetical protein